MHHQPAIVTKIGLERVRVSGRWYASQRGNTNFQIPG